MNPVSLLWSKHFVYNSSALREVWKNIGSGGWSKPEDCYPEIISNRWMTEGSIKIVARGLEHLIALWRRHHIIVVIGNIGDRRHNARLVESTLILQRIVEGKSIRLIQDCWGIVVGVQDTFCGRLKARGIVFNAIK